LEEGDREEWIVTQVWPNYWKRLGGAGDAPDTETCSKPLQAVGLVDAVGNEYRIHPGVAEAGREQAGEACQAAVDVEMAEFWSAGFLAGVGQEMRGGGRLILRAGLGAVPYLMRREKWNEASALVEQVIVRDPSVRTLAAVVPLVRRMAEEIKDTESALSHAGVLARTLHQAGQVDEAEKMMRDILRKAEQGGQLWLASGVAGDLSELLRITGRLKEALEVIEKARQLTNRAQLGPWTLLASEQLHLVLLC